jgi:hypothetical protein
MRCFALTLYLAFALSAGCGKKPDAPGPGSPPPPPAPYGQSNPSNVPPIDPATTGGVSGVVKLNGWLKPDGELQVGQVPYCASCHPNGVVGDSLVLGDGQTMANVLVYVNSTFKGRQFPVPSEPADIDQVGCIYAPHVRALRVNQTLNVRNSDSIPHNIHAAPKLNNGFNFSQGVKGAIDTVRFPIPELSILVKCDVHPWMKSWIHVLAHPFFQVTGKDGAFKIEGLPPGEYEIRAWHERFPDEPKVAMVTVETKKVATLDFEFKGGTKPPDKTK